MYYSNNIKDTINIFNKKFTLSKSSKIYKENYINKFIDKPAEIYHKINIKNEFFFHQYFNIDYHNLSNFLMSLNNIEDAITYYQNKKLIFESIDKKYLIAELFFQPNESYKNYKLLNKHLIDFINKKLESYNNDISKYQIIMKAIARFILIETKFNRKNINLNLLETWILQTTKFENTHNYYHFMINPNYAIAK